ncbi:PREDICTED: uncharacterized protein LOC104598448 [Nelumbo nucifera]|uniref:Uncharacterized protein LOC104598448 n=1 Tax=Nelumbo nucifera TaxID=4432 RepID=A0A1U8AAX1_NELNU|nr:PREDICTED: uncharacterized protein LOC104598448 [Nelumbo nucifera]
MVFQALSEAETSQRKSMATAPVKSQPLHNFSLSFLKWGKNQVNNHRCRKPADTTRESPPHDHRSSASESEPDGASLCKKDCDSEARKLPIGSRSVKNRFSFASCSTTPSMEKSPKSPTASETEAAGTEDGRSKLLIRLRPGGKEESASKNKTDVAADEEGKEVEEPVSKPWNLRPRRAIFKAPNEIGGVSKNGELQENVFASHPENLPKSLRLRGFAEAQHVEKKEKQKFSISLSREEIEEDIFVMTGSKPARRPKKRAKNIQKQLDNVFPGLWLAGITPDSYKVPDVPTKR